MFEKLNTKIFRDLLWVIKSEQLIDIKEALKKKYLYECYENFYSSFKNIDLCDDNILVDLKKKTLGKYFEMLVFFWLDKSDRFILIEHNIPVLNTQKKTIGEIDLIVFDKKFSKFYHWELCVKYYLAYQFEDKLSYIGPNSNDFLNQKLDKLKKKQLTILNSKEGQIILNSLNIKNIESKILMKGMIFYNHNMIKNFNLDLNKNHSKSWWIYENEINDFLNQNDEFCILDKLEWMSDPLPKFLFSYNKLISKLKKLFSKSDKSVCLAIFKNKKYYNKGFIVSNAWPKKFNVISN